MMFSVPGPENDDRRDRELAVSGRENVRLVSCRYDHVAGVTTYVGPLMTAHRALRSIASTKKSMCRSRAWIARRW